MSSNIMPGRLRDVIEILQEGGSDDWGTPGPPTVITKLRGNVNVRSGDQNVDFGVELSSEIITVLTYYRESINENYLLKWLGRGKDKVYEIRHVKPADNSFKSMIITAELKRNG